MPADAAYGSISTLPLAWRTPWTRSRDAQARQAFDKLDDHLARVRTRTGRQIRVAIEPEPGCVLEMVDQAANWLIPYGEAGAVGICLDTCHLAVQFEEPAKSFAVLADAKVPIVKSQVSAALHVAEPWDPKARELLTEFAEPKFLHQTREYGGPGVDNLDLIGELSGHASWRVHFHVPVHAAPRPPLTSTTGRPRREPAASRRWTAPAHASPRVGDLHLVRPPEGSERPGGTSRRHRRRARLAPRPPGRPRPDPALTYPAHTLAPALLHPRPTPTTSTRARPAPRQRLPSPSNVPEEI